MAFVELVYKTIRSRRCCLDCHASQFSLKWEHHVRKRRSEQSYYRWCRQEFFQCEFQLSDQDSLGKVNWNAFSLPRQFQSSKVRTKAHCSPLVSSLQGYVYLWPLFLCIPLRRIHLLSCVVCILRATRKADQTCYRVYSSWQSLHEAYSLWHNRQSPWSVSEVESHSPASRLSSGHSWCPRAHAQGLVWIGALQCV